MEVQSWHDYWKCQNDRETYEAAIILLSNIHKEEKPAVATLCNAQISDFDNNHPDFPFYPEMQEDLIEFQRGFGKNYSQQREKDGLIPRVNIKYWGDALVIKRFENDIVYDMHSLTARVERSEAGKEIYRRGQSILRPIIAHLKNNMPEKKFDLDTAWGWLLNRIEIKIDPDKSGPEKLNDTDAWIKWAEKFAV